jgi:hypothetical protein
MVAGYLKANPPFNRRLQRSVQIWLRGTFGFNRKRNSIYEEEHYRDVFLKAVVNNNSVMMNGASKSLNLNASRQGLTPLYFRRGPSTRINNWNGGIFERHFPAGKTILWHIKNEYEIVDGSLRPSLKSRKHLNILSQKVADIVGKAIKHGDIRAENSLTGVTLAFDYTDQDYWGLPNADIVKTRAEGTKTAYRYGMARLICPRAEYCLPPIKIGPRSQVEKDLESAIHQANQFGLSINTILLDRAFFTIDCINLLRRRSTQYVMPAKFGALKREMQRIIEKTSKDHVSVHRYTLGHDPKHSASAFIVVVPPKWQELSQRNRPKSHLRSIAFATSLRPRQSANQAEVDEFGHQLSRIYRLRFGIETDWSILKTFRPRTTSPSAVIRLFYFYMSVLLYDAWVYARRVHCGLLIRLDFLLFYIPTAEEHPVIPTPSRDKG